MEEVTEDERVESIDTVHVLSVNLQCISEFLTLPDVVKVISSCKDLFSMVEDDPIVIFQKLPFNSKMLEQKIFKFVSLAFDTHYQPEFLRCWKNSLKYGNPACKNFINHIQELEVPYWKYDTFPRNLKKLVVSTAYDHWPQFPTKLLHLTWQVDFPKNAVIYPWAHLIPRPWLSFTEIANRITDSLPASLVSFTLYTHFYIFQSQELPIKLPPSLKHFKMSGAFRYPSLTNCPTLESLCLTNCEDEPLPLPSGLKSIHLTIRDIYSPEHQHYVYDSLPSTLEEITLKCLPQEASLDFSHFTKLRKLELSKNWDERRSDLDNDLMLPDGIEELILDSPHITAPLVSFPSSLKKLKIATWYQLFSVSALPQTLAELDLRLNARQFITCHVPLEKLPATLKILRLDAPPTFNSPLVLLPAGLEELRLRARGFNRPVDSLPCALRVLRIVSRNFNQPVDALPSGLEILSIRGDYTFPLLTSHNIRRGCGDFNQPLNKLPIGLQELDIHSGIFSQGLKCLPAGLESLSLKSYYFAGTVIKDLPGSLRRLELCTAYELEIVNLPSALKYLDIDTASSISIGKNAVLPETLRYFALRSASLGMLSKLPRDLNSLVIRDVDRRIGLSVTREEVQLPSNLKKLTVHDYEDLVSMLRFPDKLEVLSVYGLLKDFNFSTLPEGLCSFHFELDEALFRAERVLANENSSQVVMREIPENIQVLSLTGSLGDANHPLQSLPEDLWSLRVDDELNVGDSVDFRKIAY